MNDVWKYENDILKPVDVKIDNNDEEGITIKIHASNAIHIYGKVKGRKYRSHIDRNCHRWNNRSNSLN
jgi:hypothetical protein